MRNHIVRTAVFALLITSFSWGQTPSGEIIGTVTDSSGAVTPNATATLVNPATNATRTAKTNDSGIFDFPALPPGD